MKERREGVTTKNLRRKSNGEGRAMYSPARETEGVGAVDRFGSQCGLILESVFV